MMISNEHDDWTESRLPSDPAYWNALANRIVESAEPLLEEHRIWEPWWNPLARFGPPLGVAAAAAMMMVWFIAPAGAAVSGSEVVRALAPNDPVAREFVLSAEPPDISALLPLHQEGPR